MQANTADCVMLSATSMREGGTSWAAQALAVNTLPAGREHSRYLQHLSTDQSCRWGWVS